MIVTLGERCDDLSAVYSHICYKARQSGSQVWSLSCCSSHCGLFESVSKSPFRFFWLLRNLTGTAAEATAKFQNDMSILTPNLMDLKFCDILELNYSPHFSWSCFKQYLIILCCVLAQFKSVKLWVRSRNNGSSSFTGTRSSSEFQGLDEDDRAPVCSNMAARLTCSSVWSESYRYLG